MVRASTGVVVVGMLAGCPDQGLKGPAQDPLKARTEAYEIVGTIVSDTCFGETGDTTGGEEAYTLVFEREGGVWSVLLDSDIGLVPCTGSDTEFGCSWEAEATESNAGTWVFTFEGTRDEETLDATFSLVIGCDGAPGTCTECSAVEEIVGTAI